jgi:L-ascorbate metabolism protein UlaG (beta-lactamase superfamily)
LQRRTILAGLAALPVLATVGPAFAQEAVDTIATSGGDVGIHPVMHASLALSYGEEVFYVDPAENSYEGLPAPTAIFITHAHGDHYNEENLVKLAGEAVPIYVNEDVFGKLPEALKSRATAMKNGDSATVNGVGVEAILAYNITEDRKQYHPQGVGNGYVFTFGDKKIYVAGDTEDIPEMRALEGIDIAFVPMNLPYTMDVVQAASAVREFAPRVVYPYHYGESDTAEFLRLVTEAGGTTEVVLADWYPAG